MAPVGEAADSAGVDGDPRARSAISRFADQLEAMLRDGFEWMQSKGLLA
jgi:hypothetical protein